MDWAGALLKEHAPEILPVIPAFELFLKRHDLHLGPSDCTHFLFSPFLYDKVWENWAKAVVAPPWPGF